MNELKESYKYCSSDDLKEMYFNSNKYEKQRITKELNRREVLK